MADVLLYCPPGYPTSPKDIHIPEFFQAGYLGLSSHCMAPELPVAAVARGCKLIEMHVMLADEPSELESNVSLNEHQVEELVRSIRRTEEMLG
jgi:sialic acid synthase SpsE